MVQETLAGKYGNGDVRKANLGDKYQAVMDVINGKTKTVEKTDEELAKEKVQDELAKYNFHFTDEQLNTFIEASVHAMNSAWKGE